MGFYRSPSGDVVEISDEDAPHAQSMGYLPVGSGEAASALTAPQQIGGGILGGIGAGVTSTLSGATLGISDVIAKGLLSQGDMDALAQMRAAHPYVSTAGQIAGAIAPALLGDEAGLAQLTPAGFTANLGAKVASNFGSRIAGTAASAALEGAAQNAGSYISDVALGNRDLSAEGFLGAMGKGALYGGVAGGALAVAARGAIAARKLFPLEEQTAEGVARAKLAAQQAVGDSVDTSTALEQTGRDAAQKTDRETQQFLTDLEHERATMLDQAAQQRAAQEGLPFQPKAETDLAENAPPEAPASAEAASTEAPTAEPTAPPKSAKELLSAWREKYPAGAVDYDAASAAARRQRLAEWAQDFEAASPEDATVKAYFSNPQDPIGMPRNLTDVPQAVQQVARKAAADASHEAYIAETARAANVSKSGVEQFARATYAGRRAAARAMDDVYAAYKAGQPIVDIRSAVSKRLMDEIHEVAQSRADMLHELAAKPDMASDLMSQLQGTQTALDQGAALGDVSKMSLGERIVRGIQKPIDPDQAVANAVGKSQDINEDIARIAPKVTRYEAANAKLTESLGDQASQQAREHAAAFRAAEAHAANANARTTAEAAETINAGARGVPVKAQPGGQSMIKGLAKRASQLGELAETLSGFGIAHIGLHSIPVIGPALSAILKAKVLAKVVGGHSGSFAATAEGTIAAKAATVQNRIRAAVGTMIDRSANKVLETAPELGAAAALGFKLFDDGKSPAKPYSSEPDEGKLADLYGARLDELTAAMQPGAVHEALRSRINTSDPTIVDAIVNSETAKLTYLYNLAPKPESAPLPGQPAPMVSKAEMLSFGKILAAHHDPAAVFERVAKGGVAHPDEIAYVQHCCPQLLAMAQSKAVDALAKAPRLPSYAHRIAMSSLLSIPLDPTARADHAAYLQSTYRTTPHMPQPSTPPSPTLSSSISLGEATLTRLDR